MDRGVSPKPESEHRLGTTTETGEWRRCVAGWAPDVWVDTNVKGPEDCKANKHTGQTLVHTHARTHVCTGLHAPACMHTCTQISYPPGGRSDKHRRTPASVIREPPAHHSPAPRGHRTWNNRDSASGLRRRVIATVTSVCLQHPGFPAGAAPSPTPTCTSCTNPSAT